MMEMTEMLTVKMSLKPLRLASTSKFSLPSLALPSLAAFKPRKKNKRLIFFYKLKRGVDQTKKRKVQVKEVTIQVGVMDDCLKSKRETIPLKVNSLTSKLKSMMLSIIVSIIESNYQLIFKDGSNVNFIPGN
jgi:hypothetical protein